MLPTVSVIVPCLNEEKTIHLLLDALFKQTYPHELLDIVIADGLSIDKTRDVIVAFGMAHPDMKIIIVDNTRRNIPSGLNLAIQSAKGDYVVRLDAHSFPNQDYISRCIQAHLDKLAENVGGVWDIQPQNNSLIARSIAAAAAHPLAVGDAKYRYTDQAEYVDTVPFGSFQTDFLRSIGGFDETLLTNEDYELNTRIRQAGGRVWLDPQIRTTYFSRANLKELATQYWRYGFWKAEMIKRYPSTLRLRQGLPPAFVAGLVFGLLFGLWFKLALWALLAALTAYAMVLLLVGIQIATNKKQVGMLFGVPLAIATMQLTWGGGFLAGLFHKRQVKKVGNL